MTDEQDVLIVRHRDWIERSLNRYAELPNPTEEQLAHATGLMQQLEAIDKGDWKQAFCLEIRCNLLASKIVPTPEEAAQN
jgi:hypothetical protein